MIWFVETEKLRPPRCQWFLFTCLLESGIPQKFAASPRKLFSNAERCKYHYIRIRNLWHLSWLKLVHSPKLAYASSNTDDFVELCWNSSILRNYFLTFSSLQAQEHHAVCVYKSWNTEEDTAICFPDSTADGLPCSSLHIPEMHMPTFNTNCIQAHSSLQTACFYGSISTT